MVDGGIGCRSGRGQATCLDDCRATLADGGQEDILVPCIIINQGLDLIAARRSEAVVGIHGGGVVAPDGEVLQG